MQNDAGLVRFDGSKQKLPQRDPNLEFCITLVGIVVMATFVCDSVGNVRHGKFGLRPLRPPKGIYGR